jgi:hypothetical protein
MRKTFDAFGYLAMNLPITFTCFFLAHLLLFGPKSNSEDIVAGAFFALIGIADIIITIYLIREELKK